MECLRQQVQGCVPALEVLLAARPGVGIVVLQKLPEPGRVQHEDLRQRTGTFAVEQMGKESAELRRHPEVNAYLDAELALCKMMQKICVKLAEGIDMDIPGAL